ncbi:hypothetical protein LINPERPRIM_LOCUS5371 [Linum perenne]
MRRKLVVNPSHPERPILILRHLWSIWVLIFRRNGSAASTVRLPKHDNVRTLSTGECHVMLLPYIWCKKII